MLIGVTHCWHLCYVGLQPGRLLSCMTAIGCQCSNAYICNADPQLAFVEVEITCHIICGTCHVGYSRSKC